MALAALTSRLRDPQTRVVLGSLVGGAGGRLALFAGATAYAALTTTGDFATFSALLLALQSISGLFSSVVSNTNARLRAVPGDGNLTIFLLPLRFGVLSGLVGLVIANPVYRFLTGLQPDRLLLVVAFLSGVLVFVDGLLGAFAGRGATRIVAGGELLRGTGNAAGLLLGGMLAGPNFAIIGCLVGDCLVAAMLTARLLLNRIPPSAPLGETTVRTEYVAERRWRGLVMAGIVANVLAQVTAVGQQGLLSGHYGTTVIGTLAVANRFASLAIMLPTMLTRNMVGLIGRSVGSPDPNAFSTAVRRYALQVSALAVTAGGVALVAALTVFGRLFDKYDGASTFLVVIVLSSIPSALGSALGVICLVKRYYDAWLVSDVVLTVVTLSLTLLVTRMDLTAGFALASIVAGQLCGTLCRAAILVRRLRGERQAVELEARLAANPDSRRARKSTPTTRKKP